MRETILKLFIVALLAAFATTGSAQDVTSADAPETPDFRSLSGDWWSYFEGAHEDVEPRVTTFLAGLGAQIAELQPQNQLIAQSVLAAVEDNISAYVDLLDEPGPVPLVLDPAAEAYTLDELLDLAAESRRAAASANEEQLEVEREQRVLAGASRRRDAAFEDYIDSGTGDARWLSGLRLFQARSAQAISVRRLNLLSESYERANELAAANAERVDLARERLATTIDDEGFEKLVEQVAAAEAQVVENQERLRQAEVAAVGLDLDTIDGRSQQRLLQQRRVDAEIELALAELALAQAQARRWWTELQLDRAPDFGDLQEQSLAWSELIRDVTSRALDWKRDTEDELLAVQSTDRDGLSRALRRLLDQRLGTAQETLGHIGTLEAAIADLELLSQVTDDASGKYVGPFRSSLAGLSKQVKALYNRALELADSTLFSISEAPITGGDILRVIMIFVVALLLSRIIRLTIRRVSVDEDPGTQASMYTVARLTHYAIVIFAIFIALSSVGLDFSNLALVAGALGVGLGFGLQSIVSNFVSGLIILFERSLRAGDYIELDTGLTGTVKAINVRSTLINTNDNIDIVVPNSEFVTTKLTNWTLGERTRRMRIPFGVAYGSDKELVRKAGIEAANEVSYTLTHMKGREPDVWLVGFGDSSLDFLLLVWVNRQGARRPTRTTAAYLWALETKLSEYGIEIPFPQRDLHLRSGWSPNTDSTSEPPDVPEPDAGQT
jgi:small-conductance mechanosensitive channel